MGEEVLAGGQAIESEFIVGLPTGVHAKDVNHVAVLHEGLPGSETGTLAGWWGLD